MKLPVQEEESDQGTNLSLSFVSPDGSPNKMANTLSKQNTSKKHSIYSFGDALVENKGLLKTLTFVSQKSVKAEDNFAQTQSIFSREPTQQDRSPKKKLNKRDVIFAETPEQKNVRLKKMTDQTKRQFQQRMKDFREELQDIQRSPQHRKIRQSHERYEQMLTQNVAKADHAYGAVVAMKVDKSITQSQVDLAVKQNKKWYDSLISKESAARMRRELKSEIRNEAITIAKNPLLKGMFENRIYNTLQTSYKNKNKKSEVVLSTSFGQHLKSMVEQQPPPLQRKTQSPLQNRKTIKTSQEKNDEPLEIDPLPIKIDPFEKDYYDLRFNCEYQYQNLGKPSANEKARKSSDQILSRMHETLCHDEVIVLPNPNMRQLSHIARVDLIDADLRDSQAQKQNEKMKQIRLKNAQANFNLMKMSTKDFRIQLNTGIIKRSLHSLPKLQGSAALGQQCYRQSKGYKSEIDKRMQTEVDSIKKLNQMQIDCDTEDLMIHRVKSQIEGLEFQLAALGDHKQDHSEAKTTKVKNGEDKMSKARVTLERMHLAKTISTLNTMMQEWQIKKLEKTAKLLELNNSLFAEADNFVSQAWHVEQQKKQHTYIKFKLKAEELIRAKLWSQFYQHQFQMSMFLSKRNEGETLEITEEKKEQQSKIIENCILNIIDIGLIQRLSETQEDIQLEDIVDLDEKGCIIDPTEEQKMLETLQSSKTILPSINLDHNRNQHAQIQAAEEKIANLRKGCFTLKVPDSHPIQVNALKLKSAELEDLKKKYVKQAQQIENDILKDNLNQQLNFIIFGKFQSDPVRLKNRAHTQKLVDQFQKQFHAIREWEEKEAEAKKQKEMEAKQQMKQGDAKLQ